MQSLTNYIAGEQTALFKKHKAFFAFSNEQLEQGKKENGITEEEAKNLVQVLCGMIVPKENAQSLITEHRAIVERGIEKDIAENGIQNIIERELANHEAYYTGEIEDTVEYLSRYNVTSEQVLEVYKATQSKHYND